MSEGGGCIETTLGCVGVVAGIAASLFVIFILVKLVKWMWFL